MAQSQSYGERGRHHVGDERVVRTSVPLSPPETHMRAHDARRGIGRGTLLNVLDSKEPVR